MHRAAAAVLVGAISAAALACARRSDPAAPVPVTPATAGGAPAAPAPAPRCAWAQGWARDTPGGAGGNILRVTTLAERGSGSLAEALSARGPRIVVFEVGGVIDLKRATLAIKEPFLTVAGQTAPAPGVTLIRGSIKVATHDVVIQHLRVRPGEAGEEKESGWEPDGISSTTGTYNLVVDHCSLTWAVDENLSASGGRFVGGDADAWRLSTSHRVTFSNNIVAEGLSHSTHQKGEHSKGSLIHDNVTDVLVFGNLYASNVERNPFFKGGARGVVANNFIANPGKYAMKYTLVPDEWDDHPYQTGQMVVVGNVLHYGPNTPAGMPLLFSSGAGKCDVFLDDNLTRDRAGQAVPLTGGALANFIPQSRPPLWPPAYEAMPADKVAAYVRQNAGARPWERDAIDARIVEEAFAGRGKIIDSEQDVGGYPAPPPAERPFDPAAWDPPCLERRQP